MVHLKRLELMYVLSREDDAWFLESWEEKQVDNECWNSNIQGH